MKRKGCCFGCLAVLLVAVLALCALAYWGLRELDFLGEAPRCDTAAHIGGNPALCIHVDPGQPSLTSLLGEGLGGSEAAIEAFLPHEVCFAILPDPETGTNHLVLAASMRRLGGLLAHFVSSPEEWRWWPGQEVVSAALEGEGVWVVRSRMAVSDDTRRQVDQWWEQMAEEPLKIAGGHGLEIFLDNREGRGMLALEPLLVAREGEPNDTALMQAPLDIEGAARLPAVFRRLRTLQIVADLSDDVLHIAVEAQCRDAAAAESFLFLLLLLRDAAYRMLIEEDVVLTDTLECSEALVHGDVTVSGYRAPAIRQLQSMLR